VWKRRFHAPASRSVLNQAREDRVVALIRVEFLLTTDRRDRGQA
jgi:hypothetical protein